MVSFGDAKTLFLAALVAGIFALLGTAAFGKVAGQLSTAKRALS